jgi:AraC family transcriptional regulator
MEESLSIENLAGAAGLSPIHFARQFKRTTGTSPHQFLMEARVARARDLLASRLSIAEIAYRCGFSHQEHMTRLFGRQLGVTPAAYRKSLLN